MPDEAVLGELDLELVRLCVSPEGAFGVLMRWGVPAGPVTLERTYPVCESEPLGAQFVKIPAGRYVCRRTTYLRGGYDTYEVTGVVGHSRLLFHYGNVEADSEGCILVGRRFGMLNDVRHGVLESRLGFADLMRITRAWESFGLIVRGIQP